MANNQNTFDKTCLACTWLVLTVLSLLATVSTVSSAQTQAKHDPQLIETVSGSKQSSPGPASAASSSIPDKDAFQAIQSKALHGDALAQEQLGIAYEVGRVIPKDLPRAYFWLSLAAASDGLTPAEESHAAHLAEAAATKLSPKQIARMKARVAGWRPIPPEAPGAKPERCCKAASLSRLQADAAQGNLDAEFALGASYFNGSHGAELNWFEAEKWLHKAAQRGHEQAQETLSRLYAAPTRKDQRVHQNWSEAYFWFLLAAQSRDHRLSPLVGKTAATAASTLDDFDAQMYKTLDAKTARDIETHLRGDQIAAVKRRVRQWKPTPPPAIPAHRT